ncbi:hypothetical protein Aph02nite_91280 [Actinoplanes philippinensis]|uniref:Uncharacterized protein n=1 Tax=Actinoplanes philippinensis TaxID=35752 RepID=A0A1I2MPY4_9ACTN|nr:hypothetical protein [Actinoplanes philippinensis]GIE83178.1 hypothetical protein Aph02nite_91280 [Actinoplanes philippinensis]SFF93625.1 hypothetical protein SAMN05421541_13249 [Actinoplanes philippinensis]
MPVIDLDSSPPAAVRRGRAERSRPLVLVLAAMTLLLVAGEPVALPGVPDQATVCGELPPLPGRAGERATLALIDPRSGGVLEIVDCVVPVRRR